MTLQKMINKNHQVNMRIDAVMVFPLCINLGTSCRQVEDFIEELEEDDEVVKENAILKKFLDSVEDEFYDQTVEAFECFLQDEDFSGFFVMASTPVLIKTGKYTTWSWGYYHTKCFIADTFDKAFDMAFEWAKSQESESDANSN